MTPEQEDAVFGAYLGICVLQSMCRKAGLSRGADRSRELLGEIAAAFPTVYERVLRLSLRERPNEDLEAEI
jgi:hypothetical protein